MAKRIEELTPKQFGQLQDHYRDYMDIGRCTTPSDRPRAEAAITEMYRIIGEERPQFLWLDSPATAVLAVELFDHADKNIAGDGLGDGLRDGLRAGLGAGLRDGLGAGLRDGLGAGLWAGLGAGLGAGLRDGLPSSRAWSNVWWGQHDAWWTGHYIFAEKIGVKFKAEESRRLHLWDDVARSCGWWFPFRNICIVTERPAICEMEEFGEPLRFSEMHRWRMHCDDGPALRYRDGWYVYAIHGVRVTQQIVEAPETLTAKQITGERNTEVRRVMIERFGPDRYIKECGARVVDVATLEHLEIPGGEITYPDGSTDSYPTIPAWTETIELLRAAIKDDEALVMLHCINGTVEEDGIRDEFYIRVPPRCGSAMAAAGWTYGVSAEEYAKQAVRT